MSVAPVLSKHPENFVVVPVSALAHETDGPTRGYAHLGWPEHPSSEPGRLEFGPLMMVADGTMHPGEGFPLHHHESFENLLVMLDGTLHHRDHLGGDWLSGPDDLTLMSAGAGGEHSEVVVGDETVRALVICIESDKPAEPCAFHRLTLPWAERRNRWVTLASGRRSDGGRGLPLRHGSAVLATSLSPGRIVDYEVAAGRGAYLMCVDGGLEVNGHGLGPGDRVMVHGETTLSVFSRRSGGDARVVLIDLPFASC